MEYLVQVGSEYKKLGYVSDLELEPTDYKALSTEPVVFTYTGEFVDENGRNAIRMIASGGDKGLYNALTLREDGYLSPKNAWI